LIRRSERGFGEGRVHLNSSPYEGGGYRWGGEYRKSSHPPHIGRGKKGKRE